MSKDNTTAQKPVKEEFEGLEEDDEFEEFEATGGIADEEDLEDQKLWEDDWDTDAVDDEFEEFEATGGIADEEDLEDQKLWEDDWDTDAVDDDFSKQLRNELAKTQTTPMTS
eukprot:TRINITY_DN3719_c0_g1_i1.p2 TRINITY_DN3719_c0_g1~~TRINITY_DN3719_c0_g1_i1.p2  ORF type:complete len:112 (-),score=56.40 TRINITY_DN3719_c0_g1_i1:24-359(-)